ncbi:TonB-dependent receptor [Bordetella sp. BOR01]|uniref:TonB-dependent siderophore receptor n=1 Tax=Bordetella sp. BOR01 TaxID=2854779 RepID=UPI001C46A4E9|nr:TonB-dependent receptor [Bordetella sp. BOR01]
MNTVTGIAPQRPPVALRLNLAAMAVLAALAQAVPVHAQAQAPQAPAAINIVAQPLGDALIELGRQTSLQFFYTPETVQGLSAPAVSGQLTPEQALARLLRGTGIDASRQGNSITLSRADAVSQLQTVTVVGQQAGSLPPAYEGGQIATGGSLGMLGTRDFMEMPFNFTSFTAQQIRNQQASSVADVLVNDPSVRAAGGERGGESETFTIRGFPLDSTDMSFNGLPGLAPIYKSGTDYIERVEVLKGPSALLNGMSPTGSVGGAIDVIPKRADDDPLTRVRADYRMTSQYGGAVDIGRRFGENNRFGIRVNASHRQGDTGVDHQDSQATLGSVGLDYRGERLRVSADYVGQEQRTEGNTRGMALAEGLDVPDAPNARRNPGQSWEHFKTRNTVVAGRAEYDFTDAITGFAGIGHTRGRFSGIMGNPTIINEAGDTQTRDAAAKFIFDTTAARVGLRARFDTGAIGHSMTLAGDYLLRKSGYTLSPCPGLTDSNIYNPIGVPKPDCGGIPTDVPWNARTTLTSVALADTLSYKEDLVQLTLGVRQQRVEAENYNEATGARTSRYDEDALTPMVGLVVRPWQQVSFYGNYIEGLSAGQTAPIEADNAGEVFPPYKSKQYEIGVKYDSGSFGATLAAFQVKKPSGNMYDNVFSVNGEQRNRGLELNVFGTVTRGVRLLGGAVYYDAELTKTPGGANTGNRPINVPRFQANLGAEWDLPALPGLTLTSMLVYNGSQYLDQANTQKLPDWTRLDLGARYHTKIAGTPTVFRLNVFNVFNKNYWTGPATDYGSMYLGAPRTAMLSVTFDF